ncbi:MAG: tRNA pseudouridine(55) synthase, partial [Bacteroidales bacterium]|nr:tRNA pseudouridine(55) synthase [Bacteroidales bacterium]
MFSGNIEDYPEGIILPIDKPYRWTSADVIRKLKWAAIHHFGKKNLKVGHAGTLDPLATGVLLVCIGNATKQAESLQKHDKEYIAGITFGATTPSYDLEKEIDQMYPTDGVSEESLRKVLPSFLGAQEQVAPLFSAKSVDGVRAYELARREYKAASKEGKAF